jgi:hypothetical protein
MAVTSSKSLHRPTLGAQVLFDGWSELAFAAATLQDALHPGW